MAAGIRFEFVQEQFDLLCADLARFPLPRGGSLGRGAGADEPDPARQPRRRLRLPGAGLGRGSTARTPALVAPLPHGQQSGASALPDIGAAVRAFKDITIDSDSFETKELLAASFERWAADIKRQRLALDARPLPAPTASPAQPLQTGLPPPAP